MLTLRNICRQITSMCLSFVFTPWHLIDLLHFVDDVALNSFLTQCQQATPRDLSSLQ